MEEFFAHCTSREGISAEDTCGDMNLSRVVYLEKFGRKSSLSQHSTYISVHRKHDEEVIDTGVVILYARCGSLARRTVQVAKS